MCWFVSVRACVCSCVFVCTCAYVSAHPMAVSVTPVTLSSEDVHLSLPDVDLPDTEPRAIVR